MDTSAQEGAARAGSQQTSAGPGVIDDEEGERLIQEYRRQAGTVGPRKLFSDYKVDPHLSVGVAYDDNILASSGGRKLSDAITTLAGGVTVSLGDYKARSDSFLVLNYTATGEIFAVHGEENAVDHDASLIARYRPHQLMVQLTSTYQLTHDATADIGERVAQQLYGEGLLFRYFRNDYTTLEAEADYSYYDYADRAQTGQVWGGVATDYLLASKVSLGAGVVAGHLEASGGLEETFQQLQARLGYNVTNQVTLSLRAGLEIRERGAGAGLAFDPVFSLSGTWTPFSGTTVTLEGHRHTEASAAVAGDDFVSTGISLGVRQHLVQRFYAALDAGYENADYENITNTGSTARNDDYYTLRVSVGYDFVEWVKVEAFYVFRDDRSNQSTYTFTSNRLGVQANLVY